MQTSWEIMMFPSSFILRSLYQLSCCFCSLEHTLGQDVRCDLLLMLHQCPVTHWWYCGELEHHKSSATQHRWSSNLIFNIYENMLATAGYRVTAIYNKANGLLCGREIENLIWSERNANLIYTRVAFTAQLQWETNKRIKFQLTCTNESSFIAFIHNSEFFTGAVVFPLQ